MSTYNPAFHILESFLSNEEKQQLVEYAQTAEFTNHKSTKSGRSTAIDFCEIDFRDFPPERMCGILRVMNNNTVDWHTDGKRLAVIIHPLTDNYAPTSTEHGGESTSPMLFNTQSPHAVFNTDHCRLNLQIPLNTPYEELMENSQHPDWEFINSLYI